MRARRRHRRARLLERRDALVDRRRVGDEQLARAHQRPRALDGRGRRRRLGAMHPHQLVDGAALRNTRPAPSSAGMKLASASIALVYASAAPSASSSCSSRTWPMRASDGRARAASRLVVEPLELERHHARPIAAQRRQLRQLARAPPPAPAVAGAHDLGERLLGALGIAEPISDRGQPTIEPAVGAATLPSRSPARRRRRARARCRRRVEPLQQEAHRRRIGRVHLALHRRRQRRFALAAGRRQPPGPRQELRLHARIADGVRDLLAARSPPLARSPSRSASRNSASSAVTSLGLISTAAA